MDENGNICTYDDQPFGYWSGDGPVTAYSYDAAGNRLDQGGDYAVGNRIRQFAGCTYVTDSLGDGNVLSRTCGPQTVRFHWSAESRLKALRVVGGDSLDFRYDASGRLVRKDVNGATQAYFLWQGDNLLAELTGSATGKVAEYSYYPGLDNLHAIITATTPYFAHSDGIGNVIALTDSATKSVQRSYEFDDWGALTGGTDVKPFSNADRPRFKRALWLGPEAELYYMRARWYKPKTGRFLSEDPVGLEGGLNLYSFSGNDPVNNADPTGRDWETTSGYCPKGYKLETVDEETWCVREEIPWGDQTLQQAIAALRAWSNASLADPLFVFMGKAADPFVTCPEHVSFITAPVLYWPEGPGKGKPLRLAEIDIDVWRVKPELPFSRYKGHLRAVSLSGKEQFFSGQVRGGANCGTGRATFRPDRPGT